MTEPLRTTFTLDYLEWKPWVTRSTDTDLAPELLERATEAVAGRGGSDYIAVLTNDFPAWKTRDVVHHHTFAGDDDAQVGWRELGTVSTSRINGCVFCAAVHARIYAQKSGNRDAIDRFLADGLAAELPPIERAIVDLGATITNDPESLTSADLQPLRDLGLDDDQILDIANYTAFFANANRLMLTLGEPVFERPYRG
ncbi:MAG: peroxidase-related enzyme [Thermomicrobiales bacterium]